MCSYYVNMIHMSTCDYMLYVGATIMWNTSYLILFQYVDDFFDLHMNFYANLVHA